jgi:hypothetical protein
MAAQASPIDRIETELDEPVKGTVGSIPGATDQPVLDGVVMDGVAESLDLILIPKAMFPESPLPDPRRRLRAARR